MIRKANEKDLPRIAEIIIFGKRTAYRPIFQNDKMSFQELTVVKLYRELCEMPTVWKNMFVYDDGIIKGVIGWTTVDEEDTIELNNFYVEPVFQGQGIGSQMIARIMEELKPEYRKIMLWVIKDNVSARSFYESKAFKRTGRERIIEGTEKMDVQYIREL